MIESKFLLESWPCVEYKVSSTLLLLLLKLPFVGRRTSASALGHLFVCLVALCSGVCLPCTRLAAPFSALIQFLLFVQRGTSASNLNAYSKMYSNIRRAEVPWFL